MQRYNQTIDIFNTKLNQLNSRGYDFTMDEVVEYCLETKWSYKNSVSFSEVVNDILCIKFGDIHKFLSGKAIMKPDSEVLEKFNEIFGGK